jgi:hypothetical protein
MKSTLLILSIFLCIRLAHAQDSSLNEESVLVDEDGMVISESESKPLFTKDNLIKGSEFMVFLQGSNFGSIFLAEAAPFVGLKVKDILWFGAGLNGTYVSYLEQSARGNQSLYGVHAFGRINIAETYFLQAEFRRVNGPDFGGFDERQWLGTPVLGFGYLYGSSWLSIGYALNPDFVKINPMGNFVYRFGLLF